MLVLSIAVLVIAIPPVHSVHHVHNVHYVLDPAAKLFELLAFFAVKTGTSVDPKLRTSASLREIISASVEPSTKLVTKLATKIF